MISPTTRNQRNQYLLSFMCPNRLFHFIYVSNFYSFKLNFYNQISNFFPNIVMLAVSLNSKQVSTSNPSGFSKQKFAVILKFSHVNPLGFPIMLSDKNHTNSVSSLDSA